MCLSPIGILRANHVIKPPPAVKIQRHFISNGPLRLPAGQAETPQRRTLRGINNDGDMTGSYVDPKGNTDGFVGFPAF
jgi:hypothetical protein